MKKRMGAAFAALGLAMSLAACGSEDAAPSGTEDATAEFNDADVSFAQDMIQHHRQAIEMASLAAERAETEEVKQLAADIEAAQEPEIDTLSGWLESWGEDVPEEMSGDHSGTDMSGSMMRAEDMEALESASGAEFDDMFLTMMIEHHEGAIEMAQMEQEDGSNPDAVALAEKIETDQTAEVATMQGLLGS